MTGEIASSVGAIVSLAMVVDTCFQTEKSGRHGRANISLTTVAQKKVRRVGANISIPTVVQRLNGVITSSVGANTSLATVVLFAMTTCLPDPGIQKLRPGWERCALYTSLAGVVFGLNLYIW